jgi:hypothetical protein
VKAVIEKYSRNMLEMMAHCLRKDDPLIDSISFERLGCKKMATHGVPKIFAPEKMAFQAQFCV